MVELNKYTFFILLSPYFIFAFISYLKGKTVKTIVINFLIYFYCLLVFSLTILPIYIQKEAIEHYREVVGFSSNFIPFRSISQILLKISNYSAFKQLAGNIILFIPLSFILPLYTKRFRKFGKVLLSGFLISLGIETLQFIISFFYGFSYRTTDVDDIILNCAGVVIGFILYSLLRLCYNLHHLTIKSPPS